jgi:hypothetical protein
VPDGAAGAGVNRLSYGVQSAQPDELRLLDRLHVRPGSRGGGLRPPAGSTTEPRPDLRTAASDPESGPTPCPTLPLQPDHLSLYALSLSMGRRCAWSSAACSRAPTLTWQPICTKRDRCSARLDSFNARFQLGAELGRRATALLRACRHNLTYWRNGTYLVSGPEPTVARRLALLQRAVAAGLRPPSPAPLRRVVFRFRRRP